MTKRALLIGCNYAGTEAQLFGCVNDVAVMKSLLMEVFGFKDENCEVLVDTEECKVQPTGANIKEKLTDLVAVSEPGDVLFVHFSGHGVQIPSADSSDEVDNLDEAIVPSDLNLLVDDDLRAIAKSLKEGVVFTLVSDCCHSGGLLDHKKVHISGSSRAAPPILDVESFMNYLGLKRSFKITDPDKLGPKKIKNRSLPKEVLLRSLGEKKGEAVSEDSIRQSLTSIFGTQASLKFQQFLTQAPQIESVVAQIQEDTKKHGCWTAFLAAFGIGAVQKKPAAAAAAAPPPANVEAESKPVKPTVEPLSDDVGVLITGCQSNEKSADANISGKKKKAFGAMTNALVTVIKSHNKENPGVPISNRDLVHSVREMLGKAGFQQNPCLEGSAKNADAGFVTGEKITPPAAEASGE
ncbi:hypothetical protein BSKO_04064 [Bryopsis sp. KO-2023]|nr:hypothetical protein BSKO_04064 [Bryopsis sp. KO-2023]